MADECLSPLFVCLQARWPVLPGGHRALPQLQRSPLCRAQRAHALSGLSNRRSPEQLLHLDGKMPAAARWPGRRASNGTSVTQDLINMKTLCGGRLDLYTSSLIKQPLLYIIWGTTRWQECFMHIWVPTSAKGNNLFFTEGWTQIACSPSCMQSPPGHTLYFVAGLQ